MFLLEWHKFGCPCCTHTWTTVLHWLVCDRELTQVVTNHVGLHRRHDMYMDMRHHIARTVALTHVKASHEHDNTSHTRSTARHHVSIRMTSHPILSCIPVPTLISTCVNPSPLYTPTTDATISGTMIISRKWVLMVSGLESGPALFFWEMAGNMRTYNRTNTGERQLNIPDSTRTTYDADPHIVRHHMTRHGVTS